jgi:hypothetical protein
VLLGCCFVGSIILAACFSIYHKYHQVRKYWLSPS